MGDKISLTVDKPLIIRVGKRERLKHINDLRYDPPKEYYYYFEVVDTQNGNIISESQISTLKIIKVLLAEIADRLVEE